MSIGILDLIVVFINIASNNPYYDSGLRYDTVLEAYNADKKVYEYEII